MSSRVSSGGAYLALTFTLTLTQVGRCSLGVGMGRATWNKAAAERAANIMEGVRRSNASVQRIASREGIYRAIDSLPARE